MLMIRLARVGKTKQPAFRLIVSEKSKDNLGSYLENLGNYNARKKQAEWKIDRIKYWLEKGAQMSATVRNLLVEQKIIAGEKEKKVKITRQRREKMEKKQKATIAVQEQAEA
ncbi:MAG: 30S ribosomal protein S16 [Candidatus Magasanikbacteria bacterium]|nr:30S ribosomal protein S16 [Candidatus Magasanikbacteria bacterium]